ncbi:MAG TPA: hypothetical protein VII83_08600 [Gaiellaceae bacterium]
MIALSESQARIARQLGPLDGKRIPGGCDTCNAYQTVEPIAAGVWKTTVHHDEWCPTLAAIEGRRK